MIPVIQHSGKPLYEQIYAFYKDAILRNQIKCDQKIPSYRALARELGISNNTVLKAYEQLILEGYVASVNRSGLYVTKIESTGWQSDVKRVQQIRKSVRRKTNNEFAPSMHLVDERHFPLNHWRKCNNLALDSMSFQYQEHEPEDPLKAPLVKYLYEYRGVRATGERIIIGSGASVLLFWLGFILKETCQKIVVEEPGYARPRLLFSELGYEVMPVRVGKDGIDVAELVKRKTDLVYVTPSHQYPTGAALPVGHRIQILNWAKKTNTYIIEDDFDCEFRYKTKLMPSLQGLDQNNRVIYLGTFSNSLMPSLRVAYVVLPENFPVEYQSLSFLTATVPYYVRKTLAIFMEEGFWERHLKKMRTLYKRKYELCIEALSAIPKHMVECNRTPAGLHTFLRVNTKLSENELIRRASNCGILVMPAGTCYHEKSNQPAQPEILLEFGSIPENKIKKLMGKLFKAWFPGCDFSL